MTKQCSTCKKTKSLDQFSRRSASPDGLAYTCKECDRLAARRSYIRRYIYLNGTDKN